MIGPLFTMMDTITKYNLAPYWDELPMRMKQLVLAFSRTHETMAAWEQYLALPKEDR